mmetsp:Transcript_32181/g.77824  ORF Transcript_32181/g.77824 Transcript_32181/m.77824 type:complete len:119 (+) Transcript_32181:765-1121(+)
MAETEVSSAASTVIKMERAWITLVMLEGNGSSCWHGSSSRLLILVEDQQPNTSACEQAVSKQRACGMKGAKEFYACGYFFPSDLFRVPTPDSAFTLCLCTAVEDCNDDGGISRETVHF